MQVLPTRCVFSGHESTHVPLNTGPEAQEVQCDATPWHVVHPGSQIWHAPVVPLVDGQKVPAAHSLTHVLSWST